MMTRYSLVLFIHVTAVLILFACLSFEMLSLYRLRRASTVAETWLWMKPVPGLPLWTGGSALVAFLSGIYLAVRTSAFGQAWIGISIAAILLIAPFGALTGKRLRAIREANASAIKTDSQWFSRLQDPFLKASLGVRICIFLGIVLLMTAKPVLWQSIGIVAASVVLGVLSSVAFRFGREQVAHPSQKN
jgi:hypothetical protein